eukprot:CAMPEP_0168824554 /NCGR_PEP_ID=MMETSP0726-20121227/11157_1 /TAXON_ID=265536 /ORGANISM="Amphiprora sp., Strain CCMP467" /LENGTH=329 /DNA_ID=CAMNT_0008877565 /DNA_START=56 /DNA_END=1042 /DNA_ORIENTATION=-
MMGFYARKPSHDTIVRVLKSPNAKHRTFEYEGVHVTLGHDEKSSHEPINKQQEWLRRSSVVPIFTQGNLKDTGCGYYVKYEYPPKLVELARMVLHEAVKSDKEEEAHLAIPDSYGDEPEADETNGGRPASSSSGDKEPKTHDGSNVPFGFLHIRRGDTKALCNTTLDRMSEFLDCTFGGFETNDFLRRYHQQARQKSKFVMFFATDELDPHYRQGIRDYLDHQPLRNGKRQNLIRAVDLDQTVQLVVQREVERGTIPSHYTSNYIVFWIGKIISRAGLFTVSQRKARQCPDCSRGEVKKALSAALGGRTGITDDTEWWNHLQQEQQDKW